MAVYKGEAHKGKATHKHGTSSKLSKFNAYAKPESREVGSKKSVGGADSFIRRIHG